MPAVLIDNHGGAVKATNHLIEQGRTRILHLRGAKGNFDADERSRGFHEALRMRGLESDPALEVTGYFTREGGARAVCEAIDQGLSFDGIFAGNDEMAIGAMEELVRRGRRIPDEVALIGFDDIDLAHFVGLSTVRVPLREMGRVSARIAFELIEGAAAESKTLCPPN
jgi:LacI family transcriptional regulator